MKWISPARGDARGLRPSSLDSSLEIGNFKAAHRAWKLVTALSLAIGAGLVALGVAWNQLSPALWGVVGFCVVFAGFTWGLTWVMQSSLRLDSRGVIRASRLRERVTGWDMIAGARVGITELGERIPSLIIEDASGDVLVAYGRGLINRPLEEAAHLITEGARRHRMDKPDVEE